MGPVALLVMEYAHEKRDRTRDPQLLSLIFGLCLLSLGSYNEIDSIAVYPCLCTALLITFDSSP